MPPIVTANVYCPFGFQVNPRLGEIVDSSIAWLDRWGLVADEPDARWRARFALDLESYLLSQETEVENRICERTPDLETYFVLRRSTGMEPALLDLVEYDLRLLLSPAVVSSPEWQALRRAAEDYVDWVNDLYSWNKECLARDPHNIVAVLQGTEAPEAQRKL